MSSAVLALVLNLACSPGPQPADLIVVGGTSVTMNERQPTAEALPIRGQGIIAVGAEQDEFGAAIDRMVELATEECLSKGLTSFQDAGSTLVAARRLLEMAEAGEIRYRRSR